jgi:thiomorpholine-carboxylate dehydrogenase
MNYNQVKSLTITTDGFVCGTAVGAGIIHHSELDTELYQTACIYTDTMASAQTELKGLFDLGITMQGEVGDIINGTKSAERERITIFQSLGKFSSLQIEPQFTLFNYICKSECRL